MNITKCFLKVRCSLLMLLLLPPMCSNAQVEKKTYLCVEKRNGEIFRFLITETSPSVIYYEGLPDDNGLRERFLSISSMDDSKVFPCAEVKRLTSEVVNPLFVTAKSYTRVYGEENPKFEYEASGAKLDGEPAITCAATATSPVGEYDIVVSKGTVTNYNDHYVAGKLTITKAPLTITAKSCTRKQGEANPKFEVSYEGWKNSETSTVLKNQPVVTCEATAASEPGEYDIIVSGAEAGNYDIKYVAGKLTVTEADPVVVTAKSYIREYGEENPKFEYEASGAKLDGEPTITCAATATSPVGEYDIVVSKGTVTNYNDHYVAGKLTIVKAPLTVTAKSFTREQGETNPKFEVSYEGWKNGETSVVLLKLPVVTCEATAASEPGEYDIIVSGAEAGNYTINYVAGKLTVTVPASVDSLTKDIDATPTGIYTLGGARVNHSGNLKQLPKGVYVIQQGSKTFKYVNR